jgi:hypothetical protein
MAKEEAHHGGRSGLLFQGWAPSHRETRRPIMRPYSIAGLILIILGVLALLVRSITYFSTETQVGPLGFFAWDVSKPHTIFINPIAGIVALAVGIALILLARRPTST